MLKPCYVMFVDLQAAFDHVNRDILWWIVEQTWGQNDLVEILKSLYKTTTSDLAGNKEMLMNIQSGVRQGSLESPCLFNVVMDFVMKVFVDECDQLGINFSKFKYSIRTSASIERTNRHGQLNLSWLGYADDLVLFFDNDTNLRKGAKLLDSVFGKFLLKINYNKTKTMIFNYQLQNSSYPDTILTLNSIRIENVAKFKYLGDCIVYNEPNISTKICQKASHF